MSQLEELYKAVNTLQNSGIAIKTILDEINTAEEKIIEKEVLPIIEKIISPELQKIEREILLLIEYKPNESINVKITKRKSINASNIPNLPYKETERNYTFKQFYPKSHKTGIKVTFKNGESICEESAIKTLCKVIQTIGIKDVEKVGLVCSNVPLVSKISKNKHNRQTPIGEGYYLIDLSSTEQKAKQIKNISDYYNLGIKVEIVKSK